MTSSRVLNHRLSFLCLQITLMIFDECHSALKKHPYAQMWAPEAAPLPHTD